MKNFVQYHNVERFGPSEPGDAAEPICIYTSKYRSGVVGQRIWLFAGEGRPRRYYLSAVFIVDRFFPISDPDFFFRVDGEEGRRFSPPIEVTGYPWFQELKRLQGNFAFGLNELDERFLPYLEGLVEE